MPNLVKHPNLSSTQHITYAQKPHTRTTFTCTNSALLPAEQRACGHPSLPKTINPSHIVAKSVQPKEPADFNDINNRMPTQTLCREFKLDLAARLQAMRRQESTYYMCPDYLASEWQASLTVTPQNDTVADLPGANAAAGGASSASSSEINEMWREKICEWCYQVVDHFDFNREIVSVAMSYLDRYLATRSVNRRIFQLAAMTALYLAIKLFEPGKIRMSSLIDLSRGYFLEDHIVTMEDSVLQSLGWHVHPPTPFSFVREMINLLPVQISPRDRHDTNELARFLTELSVCDYWFVTKKPSSIALASLLNALELQGEPKIPRSYKIQLLQQLGCCGSDIYDEEVIACYDRLRDMYIAGGYSPINSSAEQPLDARVATVSPTSPIEQMEVEASTGAAGSCN